MRRRVATAWVLACAALVGCSPGSTADSPQVVVTTNILGDVVRQVVGDEADVTVLMRPNSDPHSFEISAREAALLQEADLVVSNGLGLEEGLQRHLARAEEAGVRTFVAGDHVSVLDYAEEAGGGPDPHFWTDPTQMAQVVATLSEVLTTVEEIDPDVVADRTSTYTGQLEELDAEMEAAFNRISDDRRSLVTNHHVFGYLAERYGFRLVGAVIPGGTTLASPSASDLDALAAEIDRAGVPAIFAESSQPDRLVQVLVTEAEVDVEVVELFTESLTAPGGGAETYLDMQRANTERISTGLSP